MNAPKLELNHSAIFMVLSCILSAVNAVAEIPYDAFENSYWGTNGVNLVYVTRESGNTYYGIGGNGINDGAQPSVNLTGIIYENVNGGDPSDMAWATLDADGGSFLSDARLEARGEYSLTSSTRELQFGWTTNYIGGFGYLPD